MVEVRNVSQISNNSEPSSLQRELNTDEKQKGTLHVDIMKESLYIEMLKYYYC